MALHVLGLEHGATATDIKDAYRTLVKIWHPDRFPGDEPLQQKAGSKLAQINFAYQYLQSNSIPYAVPRPKQSPSESEKTPTSDTHKQHQNNEKPQSPYSRSPTTPTKGRAQRHWWVPSQGVIRVFSLIVVLFVLKGIESLWHQFTSKDSTPAAAQALSAEQLHTQALAMAEQEADSYKNSSLPSPTAPPKISGSVGIDNVEIPTGLQLGTVTNTTVGKKARAAILLIQDDKNLHGCFVVYPPLYGSRPLSGEIENSVIHLRTNSPSSILDVGAISFDGKVKAGVFSGSYTVDENRYTERQLGTFKFNKSKSPSQFSADEARAIEAQECPDDATVAQWTFGR